MTDTISQDEFYQQKAELKYVVTLPHVVNDHCLDHDMLQRFSLCFDGVALSYAYFEGKQNDDWVLEWLFPAGVSHKNLDAGLRDAMSAVFGVVDQSTYHTAIMDIPDVNWLEESYKQFQPFMIGDFYIYGQHYDGDLPGDKMLLQIDAATAFGSGEHETTAGCLDALLFLRDRGVLLKRILDMGCGSGILSIAAHRVWHTGVLAVDIDPESVVVTDRHATANGVSNHVDAHQGDGFSADIVQNSAPYDLIIANILAGPLQDMAADMCKVTQAQGYVLLSGMLNEQADKVLEAYTEHDMSLACHIRKEKWSALLLQKS